MTGPEYDRPAADTPSGFRGPKTANLGGVAAPAMRRASIMHDGEGDPTGDGEHLPLPPHPPTRPLNESSGASSDVHGAGGSIWTEGVSSELGPELAAVREEGILYWQRSTIVVREAVRTSTAEMSRMLMRLDDFEAHGRAA
jgi:hypothetical protein